MRILKLANSVHYAPSLMVKMTYAISTILCPKTSKERKARLVLYTATIGLKCAEIGNKQEFANSPPCAALLTAKIRCVT